LVASPTPSTRAAMMVRQQIAITTVSVDLESPGRCIRVCKEALAEL
jgi:hypothetical protein